MKKILAFVAALFIALSLPLTVFAEEAAKSPEGEIVIEAAADPKGVVVGDKSADVNKKWGTSLADGLEVVFVGDAHINPTTATTAPDKTFTANADVVVHFAKSGPVVLGATFTLKADDLSPIIYLKKVESKKDDKNDGGSKKTPNTSDNSGMFLYSGLLVVALGAVAAVVSAKKRNA